MRWSCYAAMCFPALARAILACAALAGCGQSAAPGQRQAVVQEPVVNVCNWFDYIEPQVLRKFTAGYGIQVHLIPERAKSEDYVRMRTRMWTRFRTGK